MTNSFLPGRHKFKTKEDGHRAAKKRHICIDCRHTQPETYKTCPKCGSKNRKYFPSQTEANRAAQLLVMQDAGAITDLEFHPAYPLYAVNSDGVKVAVCKYVADACYKSLDENVIEDSKAKDSDFIDPLSRMKIKWFQAQTGITVKIPQRASKSIK
jgi:predicted  nucleic acid-binding Zn-ribbon protein